MTVKCRYTIANCDQGKSKFGQGNVREFVFKIVWLPCNQSLHFDI